MKINAGKLRARVAELLFQHAERYDDASSLLLAAEVEAGRAVDPGDGFVDSAIVVASQDLCGMGHYEQCRKIIEEGSK